MKYLLVLFVIGIGLWVLLGRGRRARRRADASVQREAAAAKARMTACAHCGLHVPEAEALFDAQGRAFCGDEHRRLGVR